MNDTEDTIQELRRDEMHRYDYNGEEREVPGAVKDKLAVVILAVAFLLVAVGMAFAEEQGTLNLKCVDAEGAVRFAERLATKYEEAKRFEGYAHGGLIMEAWRSEGTGTWTLLLRAADGSVCMVASGELWTEIASAPTGEGI